MKTQQASETISTDSYHLERTGVADSSNMDALTFSTTMSPEGNKDTGVVKSVRLLHDHAGQEGPSGGEKSTEGELNETLDSALKVVGSQAARLIHPAYDLTFRDLSFILQDIAECIAKVNRTRLRCIGAPVQKLPTKKDREKVQQIVEFGVGVASRMLSALHDRDDNQSRSMTTSTYDVFISYPGEEGFLYVPLLYTELEKALSNHQRSVTPPQIFLDKGKLETGDPTTVDPKDFMMRSILEAKTLVFVCSFHSVQKKWPITEFLCGLARLKKHTNNPSPPSVVIDAMPGAAWLASTSGRKRAPADWVDDIIELFQITMPPLCATVNSRSGLSHIQKLVEKIVDAGDARRRRAVSLPSAPYAKDDNQDWLAWKALLKSNITEQQIRECLYYDEQNETGRGEQETTEKDELILQKDGSFSVRGRISAVDDFHILDDGVEKELAKLLYVMDRRIHDIYWFYNTQNGKFVLVPDRNQSFKNQDFNTLADLLTHLNLTHLCGSRLHSEIVVKVTLAEAVKQAKALLSAPRIP